jgi:EAL domain-containing protein (putative c-di-GMP-specific phosphodiesterase class I)
MDTLVATPSFSPQLQEEMFQDLRELSLAPGGFFIAFQPRIGVATGRTERAEALVRWTDEVGGVRMPGEFLNTIDDWGYLAELDNWVLERAIQQGAAWERAGGPMVSVNVSVRQIESARFPQRLQDMLIRAGLSPSRLELEVTENVVIRDRNSAGQTLNAAREMGVDVAVDDFGTGQLTINTLQWMPVNVIKIGQDMCDRLTVDPRYQRLAKAMVAFAKTLDAKTVLEGVEVYEQFSIAAEAEFDEVQGFFFSRAVSSAEVARDFASKILAHQAPQLFAAAD